MNMNKVPAEIQHKVRLWFEFMMQELKVSNFNLEDYHSFFAQQKFQMISFTKEDFGKLSNTVLCSTVGT